MIGLIILYFIFILISFSIIIKNRNKLNGFLFFNIGFSIYYFIIPFFNLIFIITKKEELYSYMKFISEYNVTDLFYNFVRTIIVYIAFLFLYYYFFKKQKNGHNFNRNEFLNTQNMNKIYYLGLICLILGFLSELIIIKSFNGIVNALSMAEKLRAYGVDRSNYMPQNLLFVNILAGISLSSPFIFKFLLLNKKSTKFKVLYLLSILVSCFYLLFFAGRLPIILFVSCFAIDYVFNNFNRPWLMIGIVTVLMFLSVSFLEDFLFFLSYGYVKENMNSGVLRQVNDFSFPLSNNLAVNNMNKMFGFRYGVDYFTWIINIIPTRILQIFDLSKVPSGYEYLTVYYDPQGITLGGTPTDFLTLGMRQVPFGGLTIITILYSYVCSVVDKAIDKINLKELTFIKIRIASIMFIIVPYADYDSFFRNRFDMIIILFFVIFIIRYPVSDRGSKS